MIVDVHSFVSASPEPWATQVPPQARSTGSSAVTRPLAGCLTSTVFPCEVNIRLAIGDHEQPAVFETRTDVNGQAVCRPNGFSGFA